MRIHSKGIRTLFWLSLLAAILLVAINLTLVLAAPADPGGIGNTNLVAWFDAGTGTYSDPGCSTPSTTTGPVACWKDQSDNGLEAAQLAVANQPSLQSAALNSLPVVRFDGLNDVLGTGDDSIDELDPAFPTTNATLFVVQKSSTVPDQQYESDTLFGPFNYIPATDDWPFSLTRLGRSVADLQAAREHGDKAFVALTGSHSNFTDENGNFSLSLWRDSLDRNNLEAIQPYVNDGTIVGLYAVDEPFDWNGGTGPTLAEIDAMCAYAGQQLPGIACGVNAPASWLSGYDYQHLGFIFTQSNFQRLTSPAAWANWADQQAQTSSELIDVPLYLSVNAYTGSPTAAQIQDAALALVNSGHAKGVMMWKWGLPDFNSVPGMLDAMSTVAEASIGSQKPGPQLQSTLALSPTTSTNRFGARVPWNDNAVYWDMGDVDTTGDGRLSYAPFSDISSFHLWGFKMDSASGQSIYQSGELKANDLTTSEFVPNGTAVFIGGTDGDNGGLSGDIAELILYNKTLTDVERTHVELYLRDKYDLDLSDLGIYTAPAAYNHNVRGLSTSAQVTQSDQPGRSAGMRVEDVSFLQDVDDLLVFGHNNAPFDCCVQGPDLANSAAYQRWTRLWSFNVNDAPASSGGLVELTFDISEAGGVGQFNNGVAYILLKRATGSSDNFTDVPLVDTTVAGDLVTFRVSVADLGSEFTVGEANSPTAVQLQSFNANNGVMPVIPIAGLLFLILASLTIFRQRNTAAS